MMRNTGALLFFVSLWYNVYMIGNVEPSSYTPEDMSFSGRSSENQRGAEGMPSAEEILKLAGVKISNVPVLDELDPEPIHPFTS